MRRREWLLAFALTLVFVLCFMPVTASANSPGPNIDGTFDTNPVWVALILLITIGGIVFSCTMEWLVAVAFSLARAYEKKILLINLASQIIMRAAQYGLSLMRPDGIPVLVWYGIYVAILEVLVYVGEYLIYRRIMTSISRKYCLIYTIAANTASLVGGLIMLMIIL